MAANYKLTYFNTRGRGEGARQIFAAAGVPFDDVRINKEDWPAIKSTTPFGVVPVLEVDGVQIAQSVAIMRFLGKTFGLSGKTPLEDAKVDMVADQFADLVQEMRPYVYVLMGLREGDKEALKKDVFVPARDKHFPLLKKFLGDSFILGDRLTWADIHMAEIFSNVESKIPDLYEGFPEIEAFVRKVHAMPKLREYLDKLPSS